MKSETGKDLPTQGNKPIKGCEDTFSFGKEVFPAQGPFLCGQVEVKGLHSLSRLLFQADTGL